MRLALSAASVAAAAAVLAGGAAAAPPDVSTLILRPAQLGAGFVMVTPPDGKGVKTQATLNLCGTGYPSEKLRLTRLQTDYGQRTSPIGISNEVVTYRDGGAAQAMREVTQRVQSCPHHPVDPGIMGLPSLKYSITRISDPHLPKSSIALRVVLSGTVKGKHFEQVTYAVYQRVGNVLSGIYTFLAAGLKDAPGQEALCLRAAEASAQNLRNGSNPGNAPTA
jgi:hypothetical protein